MMRKNAVFVFVMTAIALAFVGGCDCANNEVSPCSDASAGGGGPLLASRDGKAVSEVRNEIVYNLGDNVVANSLSVTMAGGYAKPRPFERPRREDVCCGPAPLGRYEGRAAGRDESPAAVPATRIQTEGVSAGLAPLFPGDANSSPVDDVPAGSREPRIDAGSVMSELFTLTEEELRNGPDVYYPGSVQTQSGVQAAPEAPIAGVVQSPADVAAPESVAGADVAPEAELNATAPVSAPSLPAELPVPELPSLQTDKYAAMNKILPPVPTIADLEGAAEAMLARDIDGASSLPVVELPPKLN